ncbi:hypothetical protein PROFUN_05592 [Planoprotostelium fungivorum]|uniref:Uncharacterized protein n=1 Tax=Planoprotostelium fungivorum TaxID=1890364 RepID=A0A2P6N075_9EUKA|nr:hypothetical protein PROFUN_05592 [Planoprotostelium fungivorum]
MVYTGFHFQATEMNRRPPQHSTIPGDTIRYLYLESWVVSTLRSRTGFGVLVSDYPRQPPEPEPGEFIVNTTQIRSR